MERINTLISISQVFELLDQITIKNPKLKCNHCQEENIANFTYKVNTVTKTLHIIFNCKCLNKEETVNIDQIYSFNNSNYENTLLIPKNDLLQFVKDRLIKNYEFIQKFLKIIENSKYLEKYKKILYERVISSYNNNIQINIECYKLLNLINTNYKELTSLKLLKQNQFKVNELFGIEEFMYPIEDTVYSIELYYQKNYIINVPFDCRKDNHSIKNENEIMLFDGGLLKWKGNKITVTKNKVMFNKEVISEKNKESIYSFMKYELENAFQFSNGYICLIKENRAMIFDDTFTKLVQNIIGSFLDIIFYNFTNGYILKFIEDLNGFEICNFDKKTKKLKTVEYFNKLYVNKIREISNDKSIILNNFSSYSIIIFNQNKLQVETIIDLNTYSFYCFYMLYLKNQYFTSKLSFLSLTDINEKINKNKVSQYKESNIPTQYQLFYLGIKKPNFNFMKLINGIEDNFLLNSMNSTEQRNKIQDKPGVPY